MVSFITTIDKKKEKLSLDIKDSIRFAAKEGRFHHYIGEDTPQWMVDQLESDGYHVRHGWVSWTRNAVQKDSGRLVARKIERLQMTIILCIVIFLKHEGYVDWPWWVIISVYVSRSVWTILNMFRYIIVAAFVVAWHKALKDEDEYGD